MYFQLITGAQYSYVTILQVKSSQTMVFKVNCQNYTCTFIVTIWLTNGV